MKLAKVLQFTGKADVEEHLKTYDELDFDVFSNQKCEQTVREPFSGHHGDLARRA